VLGHKMTCTSADTRGDPADAVPAVNKLFATQSSLALVIGSTSDEAAAVVPIINNHKTVVFGMTGQDEFDKVKYPYFYRLVPPDLEESYAMVAIAQKLGYKRIALAFGNDIGSQTFVKPAISGISKAGMTLVANETLDLKATTFRTEAQKIVSAHPDAIMTEALGSADPTLFAEIKQLNGGKVIPIIGTSAAISPAFYQAAARAVGAAAFAAHFHADNLVTGHQRAGLRRVLQGPARGQGQDRERADRQLQHLLHRTGRRALVRRHQPRRPRDDRGEEHGHREMEALRHDDRRRRPRRHGGQLLCPGGRRPHGGEEDQVHRARRADQLRRLPRLGRDRPDRHLFHYRRRARRGQHPGRHAPGIVRMTGARIAPAARLPPVRGEAGGPG